jgi:hypothetical protein
MIETLLNSAVISTLVAVIVSIAASLLQLIIGWERIRPLIMRLKNWIERLTHRT